MTTCKHGWEYTGDGFCDLCNAEETSSQVYDAIDILEKEIAWRREQAKSGALVSRIFEEQAKALEYAIFVLKRSNL